MRFISKQQWIHYALGLAFMAFANGEVFGQVDLTKYASDGLFAIKPIVTGDYLDSLAEADNEEVAETSQFQKEMEAALGFWASGDHAEALFALEQLKEYYAAPFLSYYIGLIHFEQEYYEEAVESFNEALTKQPLFLEARYMLGMVALAQENRKEARTIFKDLIEVPAYEEYGHYGMGQYALSNGNSYLARTHFKQCIESDPTFLQAYSPLIRMDLIFGRFKQARETVESGLEANEDWEVGLMIRGMLSLFDGGFDQFERDINTLIEIDPYNYHYLSIKGFLQMELGNHSEAVRLFHDAFSLEPDTVRTGEFKFSSRFQKEESLRRTLNYYFDNYAMAPEARKHVDRAICQLMADHKRPGLLHLDSALSVEAHPVIYLLRGSAHKTSYGEAHQAVEAFTKAIELDSSLWIAYSYRAEQLLEFEDQQAAYNDYSKVIKLQPRLKEGYKNRGIILLQNGHFRNAHKDLSVAIGLDTTDLDLYFDRAIAAASMQQYENAEQDLMFILDHKPKDGEAYYLLHRCRIRLGDETQALAYLDSASKHAKYQDAYHQELIEMAVTQNRPDLCLQGHDRLVKYNRYEYDHLLNLDYALGFRKVVNFLVWVFEIGILWE